MAYTHSVTRSYTPSSGTAKSGTETITGNTEVDFQDSLPIAANTQKVLAFTRANLKSLLIKSTQDVTIYTNSPSGGSPTDTIAVKAGVPIIWTLLGNGLTACPFTANVTTIYITNASASAATVDIAALETQ